MKKIYFATSNKNKLMEAQEIGKNYKILFEKIDIEIEEIRSENIEEIAKYKCLKIYEKIKKPLIVEDAGIFIDALNGFPGTCSAYVHKKIKNVGILKLMEGIENREAKFVSCIVFYDGKNLKIFNGECKGKISEKEKGNSGFGYDPIFIPYEDNPLQETFAENFELKKKVSHRTKAVEKFCEFYLKY